MRKQLTLTTAMASALLALPGCSSQDEWSEGAVADRDTAICVDKEGKRVEDRSCAPQGAAGVSHGSGIGTAFLWYYLGRNMRVPYYGDSVNSGRFAGQGSFQPRAGASYAAAPPASRMTRSQAVSRGGLGSSSRRFGSGRS